MLACCKSTTLLTTLSMSPMFSFSAPGPPDTILCVCLRPVMEQTPSTSRIRHFAGAALCTRACTRESSDISGLVVSSGGGLLVASAKGVTHRLQDWAQGSINRVEDLGLASQIRGLAKKAQVRALELKFAGVSAQSISLSLCLIRMGRQPQATIAAAEQWVFCHANKVESRRPPPSEVAFNMPRTRSHRMDIMRTGLQPVK